jgi:hypothetical protein
MVIFCSPWVVACLMDGGGKRSGRLGWRTVTISADTELYGFAWVSLINSQLFLQAETKVFGVTNIISFLGLAYDRAIS